MQADNDYNYIDEDVMLAQTTGQQVLGGRKGGGEGRWEGRGGMEVRDGGEGGGGKGRDGREEGWR